MEMDVVRMIGLKKLVRLDKDLADMNIGTRKQSLLFTDHPPSFQKAYQVTLKE